MKKLLDANNAIVARLHKLEQLLEAEHATKKPSLTKGDRTPDDDARWLNDLDDADSRGSYDTEPAKNEQQ